MKRNIILSALLVIAASTLSANAQQSPKWLRSSAISPDGKTVAFSYQGDIFTVGVRGGQARQITSNPAFDSAPLWSADGKNIVFASYRELSKDIFVVSAEGGQPKQLTNYTGNETPLAVLADGSVLFSAAIQAAPEYGDFPNGAQLYSVSIQGGPVTRVSSLTISNLSVGANGNVLYEDYKGYEDPLRKHHTSSVTRDVWVCVPKVAGALAIDGQSSFKKLSTFKGENRNPVFAPDGRGFYFLSEESGTLNVYKGSLDKEGDFKQITFFEKNPVRNMTISAEGTLLFSQNGDLYTLREGGKPEKLEITVSKDVAERSTVSRMISSEASSFSVSPDGKEVAVIARGDVFVTSADYRTAHRITKTAEQERGVSFSADGRSIYYASEREGCWSIFKTSLTRKDDKYFTYSYDLKEERVTKAGVTCFDPQVSPDGKWLAFLRNRTEIVVKNIKSGEEKLVLADAFYSYRDGDHSFAWSPDSKYILCDYQANGGWHNQDIAMVEVATGTVTNITESGYSDGDYRWAMKGRAITWSSDRDGYRSHGSWGAEDDIYAMFLDGETYLKFRQSKEDEAIEKMLRTPKEEKKAEKDSAKVAKKGDDFKMDLASRFDRKVRLTSASGRMGDHYLTDDGKKLYYSVRLESGYDLCVRDLKEGSVKILKKGVVGRFVPDKEGKNLYIAGRGGLTKLDLASGSTKTISFQVDYEYEPAAEREYIFEHIWKQMQEKFYDPQMHGVDWAYYHDNYKQFLPYINNNFDFQDMLSELLGEMNGSHTGARYYYRGGLNTGTLGVLYDSNYAGEGLKIAEVLPGGVLATAIPELKAGAVIKAIDGEKIPFGMAWYQALAKKGGKLIRLNVNNDGKDVEVFVTPSMSDAALLYKRWVRQREEMVARLSGGRIAYVHVKGMDSESFREVYSNLLGKYRTCEAVIVDTRHNGGGWLHDDLVTLLSGQAYINFTPRGQYIGTDPFNKWCKPSCVLMGEDNYSDACGFPYVYKSLGIGKLIGAPVPGTMTAVWWENQVDPTIVFGIPEVGAVGLKDGRYIENLQVEPDILVYNDPASVLRGEDKQLEAAVAQMLKTVSK